MVSVSIIVICQEQHSQLVQLLPQLLSMQYDGEHEVIVVDKSHDKDTGEWLEEMEKLHPHLCHTFCPASARCIDIHKLALTLGAKAAAYEWVAILPAETQLPGDEWLGRLQTCCNDQTDIVIATKGGTSLWNRLTFNLFRRRFSIFRPTPSIVLCRRSILLQGDIRIPKNRISRLPL